MSESSTRQKNRKIQKTIPHISLLLAAEKNFNKLFVKNKSKAYQNMVVGRKCIDTGMVLYRLLPLPNGQSIIDSTPAGIKYTMNGWGISPVPDMGYTYGTTISMVKQKIISVSGEEKKPAGK